MNILITLLAIIGAVFGGGAEDTGTAYAAETVETAVVSTVTITDDGLTAYIG